jgi:hypothetical protein
MTFKKYIKKYPDGCKGCTNIKGIYELNPEYTCLGVSKYDYSDQCPCHDCIVKMKCNKKYSCDQFMEFRETINYKLLGEL